MASFHTGIQRIVLQAPLALSPYRQCLAQQKRKIILRPPLLSPAKCGFASFPGPTHFAPKRPPANGYSTTLCISLAARATNTASLQSRHIASTASAAPRRTSAFANASGKASAAAASKGPARSSFPEQSTKAVAYWLLGSAVSVFGIVVWGGLTRLTESGLSITEWRPVTGALPPRSDSDWEAEFTKYRASPEYARLNPHMTVEEFKKIYFMEWSHRLWGRLIGLAFVVPAVYFVVRRRVTKRMAWNLFGIAGLIGFQGFIGWWMVRSGLRDEFFSPEANPPRVSQYRLAAHLATAFVCYSWMLLSSLAILRDARLRADPAAGLRLFSILAQPGLRRFRLSVTALTGLVFTTAMAGALVAGLDAGLIYNEFPKMGVGLTPPSQELWDPHYSRQPDHSDLWWRNMLENPSLVQLDHRILATATFCTVVTLFAFARTGRVAALLPSNVKRATTGVLHLTLLQVALGICTLIYMVPIHLAATHQAGSLALLTGVLLLGHRLRIPNSSLLMIQRQLAKSAPQSALHTISPRMASTR